MISLPVLLPQGYSAVVREGENVSEGQVIASQSTINEIKINIPRELSVKLSRAKKYITKIPGEKVEKGEVIAIKKSFFGGNTLLRSREAGTIVRYIRQSGELVIALKEGVNTGELDIFSPVEGVVQLCDNKEIVIATDRQAFQVDFALGTPIHGKIEFLDKEDSYHINTEVIGKIVVSKFLSREMILKGIGIGVLGFIGVEISDQVIEYLLKKETKTALIRVDEKIYEKLKQKKSETIFINPVAKVIFIT